MHTCMHARMQTETCSNPLPSEWLLLEWFWGFKFRIKGVYGGFIIDPNCTLNSKSIYGLAFRVSGVDVPWLPLPLTEPSGLSPQLETIPLGPLGVRSLQRDHP